MAPIRQSIVYAVLFLLILSPSSGSAEGLRVSFGVTAGLSVPGTGRFRVPITPDDRSGSARESLKEEIGETTLAGLFEENSGTVIFRGKQATPEFGAEIFIGGDQLEIGLSANIFNKKGSSASLFLTPSEQAETGRAESGLRLDRRQIAVLISLRYHLSPDAIVTPYVGGGAGLYSFREKGDPAFSVHRKRLGAQGVVGLETGMGESRTRLFAEVRLNVAELEQDPLEESAAITSFTVALGIRFRG